MSACIIDQVEACLSAYNDLVARCTEESPLVASQCVADTVFAVYDNTKRLFEAGDGWTTLEDAPDPGPIGQCLDPQWLVSCEKWIRGISCNEEEEPTDHYVIYIGNENSAKDDNFDVLLNGTSIGSIDMSQDDVCNGGFWTTASDLVSITGLNNLCWEYLTRMSIPVGAILETGNTLSMNNTQNNNNGNLGIVRVAKIVRGESDGEYVVETMLLNTAYSGTSGSNFSFGPFDGVAP